MVVHRLRIRILEKLTEGFNCEVFDSHSSESVALIFSLGAGLFLHEEGALSAIIMSHHTQLKKILRSAMKGGLGVGMTIAAVVIDNFPFLPEQAYDDFIHMAYTRDQLEISAVKDPYVNIPRLMADGSYNEALDCAGYAGFIVHPLGEPLFYTHSASGGSSNLMELLGVVDGVQRLQHEPVIQINTDSRYVIRGLIQWMHYWRYNDWQTAYCTPVSNRKEWQLLYELCLGKAIEIKWIKGHRGCVEHDRCHHLAQEAAHFKH